ncbi:hypothetical protein ACEPAG_4527 [Sanghuangporus baumii]
MSGYQSFAVVGAGAMANTLVALYLVSKGVKVVTVDYNPVSSIQSVLSGVDVVISTIGHGILEVQDDLVLTAKAAGVKLFVPSEFGLPTDGPANEFHLPYAAFYAGLFPDYVFARGFSEEMGFDFSRYFAHILTALLKDRIEWRTFRIEGERTNYNQIVDDWKKRSGGYPSNFVNQLILGLNESKGLVGKSNEVTNYEFSDWNPRKVVDVLAELYGQ